MSFNSLGLDPEILRTVAKQGYRELTPIQQQVTPTVLESRDLMAGARTDTGKMAGFIPPLLQRLIINQQRDKSCHPVRALISAPVRELTAQISEDIRGYGEYLSIRSLIVFGGISINPQMVKLRDGVDMLITTPDHPPDLEH